MRTLIIAPATLSEAVMTQPLLAVLARLQRNGQIDVVVQPEVAAVYESVSEVQQIWTSDSSPGRKGLTALLRLSREIARIGYDRAFVLDAGLRAALLPWLARVPVRIAPREVARWGLTTELRDAGYKILRRTGTASAERFISLAFDGTQPMLGGVADPALVRRPAREAEVRRTIHLSDSTGLLVLCVDDGGHRNRRWPVRHWAGMIAMMNHRWPLLMPVAIGSAKMRDFATEVMAMAGASGRNLCGQLGASDQVALVAQAEAVVAQDNELMHVAAAFGRPLAGVFGPTDPRIAFPRSPRARVEWLRLACSPCEDSTCRFGHAQCMEDLRPEQVCASLHTALRLTPRDVR
jgi:heptosyltransferase-2